MNWHLFLMAFAMLCLAIVGILSVKKDGKAKNIMALGYFLLLAGMMLNFEALIANGGKMPVSQKALAEEGYRIGLKGSQEEVAKTFYEKNILHGGRHYIGDSKIKHPFLIDRFKTLGGINSIGDFIISLGMFLLGVSYWIKSRPITGAIYCFLAVLVVFIF